MLYKVESSMIEMIDYNQEELSLNVYFKNGGVYMYSPVYETQIMQFDQAESKGKWFTENIKKNKTISYKKIS